MGRDWPFFFTWTAQSSARPLSITGGSGAHFTTSDGAEWLDLGSLTYQVNAGHGHRGIIEAIHAQADSLCVAAPNAVFPAKVEVAERLLEIAPEGFSKVFFTLGGAEAVENAIKLVRLTTGRTRLVSRRRSYHGATHGAGSITGDWRSEYVQPGIPGVTHVDDCHTDHCGYGHAPGECGSHYDGVLAGDDVAGLFLETIVGANGVLIPPEGYWEHVRAACDAHGTLLVLDEILVGFGRTGTWLALDHWGVRPDLIVVGKALTSGYGTMGAVLLHESIEQQFDDKVLPAGLTGYAHPLACAAAAAALRTYREENLIARGAELERTLRTGLERVAAVGPAKHVRVKGLLGGIEIPLSAEQWRRLADGLATRHVHTHMVKATPAIIVSPPLCITEAELTDGLERLKDALSEAVA